MGYLGLDETQVKDGNMFQRLFWPSDHAGETDALGKQGFWICMGVALISRIILAAQGHPIVALFTFLFYVLGGCGVREHSTSAAVLVTTWYVLGQLRNMLMGVPPGAIGIIASLMLAANIRGTWIASRWAKRQGGELPQRRNGSIAEKIVDQMPVRVWRIGRLPFFVLSGILIPLTIVGTVIAVTHGKRGTANPIEGGKTFQVAPTR